jgi:antimicrobial peptide system SdpA family protein
MRDPQQKWIALAPLTLITLLAMAAFLTYVPQKAIRVENFEPVASRVTTVFPQGWAFFTKSPVTPRFTAYTVDRGSYVLAKSNQIEIGIHNGFGLNRAYRNAQAENEWLERSLAEDALTDCASGRTFECFDRLQAEPAFRFANIWRDPLLCGDLLVARQTPVPWAWLSLTDSNVRTTEVTSVVISC